MDLTPLELDAEKLKITLIQTEATSGILQIEWELFRATVPFTVN